MPLNKETKPSYDTLEKLSLMKSTYNPGVLCLRGKDTLGPNRTDPRVVT